MGSVPTPRTRDPGTGKRLCSVFSADSLYLSQPPRIFQIPVGIDSSTADRVRYSQRGVFRRIRRIRDQEEDR